MKIIACVFDTGFAFANTEEEVRNVIECTENVEMYEFNGEASAYIWMIKTYENRGIAKSCLLPAPRLEDLHEARFFSTEDPEITREKNLRKSRYFVLWNMEFYAIFTNIEFLVEDFFLPDNHFYLKEAASSEDAVKVIFEMYAKRVFPLYPYTGGTPIPMLGQQFDLNSFSLAPYVNYIANNCNLPKQLDSMNPLYSLERISPLSGVGFLNPNSKPTPAGQEKEDEKKPKNPKKKTLDGGDNDGTEQNRNQQD